MLTHHTWHIKQLENTRYKIYFNNFFRMVVSHDCTVNFNVKSLTLSEYTNNKQLVFILKLTNVGGILYGNSEKEENLTAKIFVNYEFMNNIPKVNTEKSPIITIKGNFKKQLFNEYISVGLHYWIRQNKDIFQICIIDANRKMLDAKLEPLWEVSTFSDHQLSLMGWDLVYATTFSQINKDINNKCLYPENIDTIVDTNNVTAKLTGKFSGWEIVNGSDGKNVQFKLNFDPETVFKIESKSKVSYKLNDTNYVVIQMSLDSLLDQEKFEDKTGNNDGKYEKLVLKVNDIADDFIIVKTKLVKEIESSVTLNVMFRMILKNWFKENCDSFKAIFARYQLNETAKNPNFSWIKPTATSYAVATHENGNNDVFGILSMVENGKRPNTQIVDPRIFNESIYNTAVLISYKKYLRHFLCKALEIMHVASMNDFDIDDENLTIRNKKKLRLCTYAKTSTEDADWEGTPGYVEPGNFELALRNNELQLNITNLKFSHAGINGYINYQEKSKLVLKSGVDVKGKNYNNVVVPEKISQTYTMQTEIELWKQKENAITKLFVGIAAALVGALVGYGFGKVAGPLIKRIITKTGSYMKITSTAFEEIGNLIGKEEAEIAKKALNESLKEQLAKIPVGGMTNESVAILTQTPCPLGAVFKRFNIGEVFGSILAMSGMEALPKLFDMQMALDKGEFSALPSVNTLSDNVVQTVQWPEDREIKVKNIEFRNVYVIRGNRN